MNPFNDLIKAMDKVIQKADDDLSKRLKKEGFISPDETMEQINELEDTLSDILDKQKELVSQGLEGCTLDDAILDTMQAIMDMDTTEALFTEAFLDKFNTFMSTLADLYIKEYDTELAFSMFTDRTTAWINEWSSELGNIMKLNSYTDVERILNAGLENGESIQDVLDKLTDAYGFSRKRARATAITELLTAHSYAAEESIRQCPSVEKKEWVHSGTHKNKPREHHVALGGTIIPKNEKFLIVAPTGSFEAMFPRDITLPASERVNCHCVHRGIVNDDVLGLTLQERRKLQQEAILEDNGLWEEELNTSNKAKAGIEI